MKTYLNYGIKIAICSDDPGFFGYKDSNPDFFVCAVAMEFDLKDFKLIAKHSIDGSILS
jgi:adenosine deaminase